MVEPTLAARRFPGDSLAELRARVTKASDCGWQSDIDPPSTALVEAEIRHLDQPGPRHHRRLPNAAVLDPMAAADYPASPTWHDTVGLVAMAAPASGAPVSVTGARALPEHDRSGYLPALETGTHVGKWAGFSRRRPPGYLDACVATIDRLGDPLAKRQLTGCEHRQNYQELSAAARARVRNRCDPTRARDRLEAFCERCRERIPPRPAFRRTDTSAHRAPG